MKHFYFGTLDKTGMMSLLNGMCENDLKELLYNLDNNLFIKYVMHDEEQQQKVRALSLKNNNLLS